jgi:hypothetical protein
MTSTMVNLSQLLSSSLLLLLLLLLSSSSSSSARRVRRAQDAADADLSSLNNSITDDEIETLMNSKFRRGGTGKVREGSYIVALSNVTSGEGNNNVTETIARLVNETQHTIIDDDGDDEEPVEAVVKVGAILQYAFRGFTWTEADPIRRVSLLRRLLNSSLVNFIEEDQFVGLYQNSGNNTSSNSSNSDNDSDSDDNDQICPGSWGLDRIDQWEPPTNGVYHHDWNGASVDVFVLDTGILATHEQFEGRATCTESFVQGKVDIYYFYLYLVFFFMRATLTLRTHNHSLFSVFCIFCCCSAPQACHAPMVMGTVPTARTFLCTCRPCDCSH